MVMKQPSLEEAVLEKIGNGEGYLYQLLILAQEHGSSFERVRKILNTHMKKNTISRNGYKFIITKDRVKH